MEKFQSTPKSHQAEKCVDIASASYEELLALPGIGAAEANILLKHRDSGKNLGSIDEMADLINLRPHIAERLKDRVKFLKLVPSINNPSTTAAPIPTPPSKLKPPVRGRTID